MAFANASRKQFSKLVPIVLICFSSLVQAKEIALTFDDAPVSSSLHFDSNVRTDTLIRKLKELHVPQVIVFANPCNGTNTESTIAQLKKYKDSGHLIGNHTCTHPRIDTVGFESFSKNAQQADQLLASLFLGQKFFRFPFLNEGKDVVARDEMRTWLLKQHYRNANVSIDNDDTVVSERINKAKALNKKIDYKKVEELFLKHILSAADFYDDLAVKQLGRSPRHVLLLHEIDATVLFIEPLVNELRKRGWKIISAEDAYRDPLYAENPKNTYSGNGIIAQSIFEKTGKKTEIKYYKWDELEADLNRVLDLKKEIAK